MTLSVNQYDLLSKILHWIMAALVLLMFMGTFGFASAITESDKLTMLTGHSSMGIIVSFLLVLRILNRFVRNPPRPVHELAKLQQQLASAMHYVIYALLILIPITGLLTARLHELPVNAFGSLNLNAGNVYDSEAFLNMRLIHEIFIKSLMFVLAGHIGAALMHGFIKKDNVLKSMSLFRRKIK